MNLSKMSKCLFVLSACFALETATPTLAQENYSHEQIQNYQLARKFLLISQSNISRAKYYVSVINDGRTDLKWKTNIIRRYKRGISSYCQRAVNSINQSFEFYSGESVDARLVASSKINEANNLLSGFALDPQPIRPILRRGALKGSPEYEDYLNRLQQFEQDLQEYRAVQLNRINDMTRGVLAALDDASRDISNTLANISQN